LVVVHPGGSLEISRKDTRGGCTKLVTRTTGYPAQGKTIKRSF